jgi:two-component system sensor histidine kinase and response regulator WspE
MTTDPLLSELFREEVRSHAATLAAGLLDLEAGAGDPRLVEPLMRAAHSIKGAARIVGIDPAVRLAHAMEDALVAAQEGRARPGPAAVDLLLAGTDVLAELKDADADAIDAWSARNAAKIDDLTTKINALARGAAPAPEPAPPPAAVAAAPRRERILPDVPAEPLAPGDGSPMLYLFREEVRAGARALCDGLAKLDAGPLAEAELRQLAEAAHAIKGAAAIVAVTPVAQVAGAIESALTAVREGRASLGPADVDELLRAVAFLAETIHADEEALARWAEAKSAEAGELRGRLEGIGKHQPTALVAPPAANGEARLPSVPAPAPPALPDAPAPAPAAEAVVRVTAQSLNRLMGLAGESLVQARWLQPFAAALQQLKKQHDRLAAALDLLDQTVAGGGDATAPLLLADARRESAACRQLLGDRAGEFEDHAARAEDLNSRLYREVIVSRMRPFGDGAHGFPRLVRDMARGLGKQVRYELDGAATEVDRDVLDKLEAPLTHLLRNAVDHGVEPPEARRTAGKSETAVVRLEARHRAGMLAITVSDDGAGVNIERLRRAVVERGLTSAEMARGLGDAELLEFLFLPGFSTAKAVSEYSGRGVGLDVVHDTVRKIGGSVRVTTAAGRGTRFHLQLPLTLSVLRAVVVTVAGEPYAFPHNRINRLVRVPRAEVRSLEGRQFVTIDGANVGLVHAAQVLELPAPATGDDLCVVLAGDATGHYGLVVDAFRGEQDLVVRPLDPRLGTVPDVSAAAVLDDGTPVLILDVEDMLRSADRFIQAGTLQRSGRADAGRRVKRVLVVDDSITVREVERQLLKAHGYDVAVAVDGQEGWNAVRAGRFDLVVSDVDMPRMDGLALVRAIRAEPSLRELPVVIVSYKERPEDRSRGLEAGADRYLTKSSFHDNTFLRAVADLIGGA